MGLMHFLVSSENLRVMGERMKTVLTEWLLLLAGTSKTSRVSVAELSVDTCLTQFFLQIF